MSSHRQLSEADWQVLDQRTDAFAQAIARGPIGNWEDFLDGLAGPLRVAVLVEMIRTDMDIRWSQGRRVFVEDYVRKYPDLTPAVLPIDLILEEWRQRSKRGDKPDKSTYLKRFPRHAVELDRQLIVETKPAILAVPETSTLPEQDRSSNYMFLEPIGRGQTGEVWRARKLDGEELAIKVIHAASTQQDARREMESLQLVIGLRHAHLLSMLSYWIENQRLYIVMELAEGSLGGIFQRYRHMQLPGIPRAELLQYFRDAAQGLDYLHEKGICHRDVKPDNLLLREGKLKVADFGLARVEPLPLSSSSMVGTPAYMAPEAWRGQYCVASDQYSLAAAYVELRTGYRAFEGSKFVDVMMGHLQKSPRVEGIAAEEQQAVTRAMAKHQEDRFPSCKAFAEALAGQ